MQVYIDSSTSTSVQFALYMALVLPMSRNINVQSCFESHSRAKQYESVTQDVLMPTVGVMEWNGIDDP